MRHLTWAGRRDVVWYAIRRLFIKPAPDWQRCLFGAYSGRSVQCPRPHADDDGLWCHVHCEVTP